MKHRQDGAMPLRGRIPSRAEWRLLERAALDMKDHIDANDLKLIRDICQKGDVLRYAELHEYWGLQSINPSVQIVGIRDACLYQLSSLLNKIQWSENISDRQKAKALDKFYSYERNMREYNRVTYRDLSWSSDTKVQIMFQRMQDFITEVLGPFDFKKASRYASHGPGGTFAQSSQLGHRYYKYASIPYEVTSNSIIHAKRLIKSDERWLRALHEHPPEGCHGLAFGQLPPDNILFQVVPGNRIEFVPKKEDEARTIALEASMNVMLQLGVDGYVRKRLLAFGININQQSINQNLARLGSIDNSLSTIDLSGASDNISMRLVEKLFPLEWVQYLFDLRSDQGILPDGSIVYYEKLSSMGNGFTFAVETLIFAACVYAVDTSVKFGDNSHVYGDDIVIPTKHVPELFQLLTLCGFIVNADKSFYSDTFTRESCGADFLQGDNIRPVFLKNTLDQLDVFAFYSLHNRLAEWFSRVLYIDDPVCLQLLRSWCSPKWLLYGPPDLENQSAYLVVKESPYGRTKEGLFIHDQAIARVTKFDPEGDYPYFQLLAHTLAPSGEPKRNTFDDKIRGSGGSQFDITRRGAYFIKPRRRQGRAKAWPSHHHEL